VRHRSDNFDKKSEPSNEMPDWWISSSWVPLEESDEESDDNVNDEEFINITGSHNNDRNNNDYDNNDNNENDNASTTTILTA
jgi:hypothetical protein